MNTDRIGSAPMNNVVPDPISWHRRHTLRPLGELYFGNTLDNAIVKILGFTVSVTGPE